MLLKKIVPWGLAGCIFLGGVVYALPSDSQIAKILKEPLTAIKQMPNERLDVVSKKIEMQNESLNIAIKIPVIQGLKNTEFQEQLNLEIFNKVNKVKQDLEEKAKKVNNKPYKFKVDYSVKSKGDILSLIIRNYTYTGGDHGEQWVDYYNIHTKESKKIILTDLFKEDSNYQDIINQDIKEQIILQEKMGETKYSEIATITADQSFYISAGNLFICFPKYEIAPRSAGIPEFRIALKDLKDVLKENIKDDALQLIGKKIQVKNDCVDIDMRIPVIQGLKDEKYQEQLNYLLTNHAMKDKESIEREGEQCSLRKQEMDYLYPCFLYSDFDLKANGDLFSFVIKTRKAVDTIRTDCYNIDIKLGKTINLPDLFKKNTNYQEVINQEIKEQIARRMKRGEQFFVGEDAFQSICDNQSFYLKEGFLVIYFPPFAIAPGPEGEKEFYIPLEKYKNIFKYNLDKLFS